MIRTAARRVGLREMFGGYKIDFGKVNWNWCHSLNIQMDEIEEMLELPDPSWFYLSSDRHCEVLAFTKYRKFLTVSFTFGIDDHLVIEDVKLPDYATIQSAVIRRFVA